MDERELHKNEKVDKYGNTHTINPRFKPRSLINFMVRNYAGSNQERGQIETTNLSNLLIWMDKLNWVYNRPGSNQERGQIETTNLSNLLIWMDKLTQV